MVEKKKVDLPLPGIVFGIDGGVSKLYLATPTRQTDDLEAHWDPVGAQGRSAKVPYTLGEKVTEFEIPSDWRLSTLIFIYYRIYDPFSEDGDVSPRLAINI